MEPQASLWMIIEEEEGLSHWNQGLGVLQRGIGEILREKRGENRSRAERGVVLRFLL